MGTACALEHATVAEPNALAGDKPSFRISLIISAFLNMFKKSLDNDPHLFYILNMFKTDGKSAKSEETRKLLMEKAVEIFLAKGFEKATLRDLSKATGLSLGSFYYYFPSKEAIILDFYRQNFAIFAAEAKAGIATSKKFEKQFAAVLAARIRTMAPEREIYLQLASSATNPKSPLSPFSPETADVRDLSVGVFYDLLQDSDLKVPKSLHPFLPHLLWFAMMGLVLFWTFDDSSEQTRTEKLIPILAKNTGRLLRALNLPLVGKYILPFQEILDLFPHLQPFAPKPINIGDTK